MLSSWACCTYVACSTRFRSVTLSYMQKCLIELDEHLHNSVMDPSFLLLSSWLSSLRLPVCVHISVIPSQSQPNLTLSDPWLASGWGSRLFSVAPTWPLKLSETLGQLLFVRVFLWKFLDTCIFVWDKVPRERLSFHCLWMALTRFQLRWYIRAMIPSKHVTAIYVILKQL